MVIHEAPLIVAGRVTVDGGSPGPGLWLRLQRYLPEPEQRRNREWESDRSTARILVDGRFEFRGPILSGRYSLSASSSSVGFLPHTMPQFPAWTRDLELELISGGALQATVLLEDDYLTSVQLQLRGKDGQVPTSDASLSMQPEQVLRGRPGAAAGGRRSYVWAALWPGRYDLEVTVGGVEHPIRVIPDVLVHAGKSNEDARLAEIDLAGLVHMWEVAVHDSAGVPIDRIVYAQVFLGDPSAGSSPTFQILNGIARVVTREPVVDLIVSARGYEPLRLVGVDGPREVTVSRWPAVTLQTAEEVPLPDDTRLLVSLHRTDPGPDPQLSRLGGGGELNFPATRVQYPTQGLGKYRVQCRLLDRTGGKSVELGVEPAELSVERDGQVVELSISDEALQKALEELKGG